MRWVLAISNSDDPVCILTHHCNQQGTEIGLHLLRHLSYHSEIHEADDFILHDGDVAGMRIAVEEAFYQYLVEPLCTWPIEAEPIR